MSAPEPTMADMRVFDWLGVDAEGVPYYLHPLNLVWSNEGVDHDLKVYRRVADLLAADPAYWGELIRERNWRHTLVGCVCLLASGRHDFYDDLCYRFRAGSWVVPQIAVTLGLLHASAARGFFGSVLGEPSVRSPKQVVSAHQVLLRLGGQPGQDITVDSWTERERDDAIIADRLVKDHWGFWSSKL